MRLNLPILDLLESCQRILIAGAGGGFDVYLGLPLYFTLVEQGKSVHLASYSFCPLEEAKTLSSQPQEVLPRQVLGVSGDVLLPFPYFPEGYLAQWFKEEEENAIPIWMFADTGVIPLVESYRALIEHLGGIDAVILVDGGVDSLMRGDEIAPGSLLEDTISLTALSQIELPVKILATAGFGTEVEEAVCHALALENMAALAKAGAFYGSCALTPQMPAFQKYEAACLYTWSQRHHQNSHISTRVIPAVRGEFGDYHLFPPGKQELFISPLMALYWFYDATQVSAHSLLTEALRDSHTRHEALYRFIQFHKQHPPRPRRSIPY